MVKLRLYSHHPYSTEVYRKIYNITQLRTRDTIQVKLKKLIINRLLR